MSKEMEAIVVKDEEIDTMHIRRTDYGLDISGKPSTEEWYDTFMKVSRANAMSQFYLGDLMVCAEAEWEGTYQDLIDLTDYEYQTLSHYATIARRFPLQFRKDVIAHVGNCPSFSAFKAVASLDDDKAKYYLEMVVNGRWSIRKLEEEVKRSKNGGNLPEPKEKTVFEIPDGWEAVKSGKYVPAPQDVYNDTEPRCLVQLYKSELEELLEMLDGDNRFLSIVERINMALEGI